MTSSCPTPPLPRAAPSRTDALPWSGLLCLTLAAFVTILTEALPAGLLPQMAADLRVTEALVGQLVTMYAVGTLVTAIPLTAATQGWRRRPLLLAAVGGFALVNTVTALSHSYALTLAARFFAGVSAGLLWALAAGYAVRMVPAHQQGRAMAVVMVGIPLALSLGIPAGTFLGVALGWRPAFGIMSALTVIATVWILARVPDFPGQPAQTCLALGRVFLMPGVRAVLFVTFAFVLAHNLLYTYVAPFLASAGMAGAVDGCLLVFGIAALAGIWATGMMIDRWLRELVLASTALFMAAAVVLGLAGHAPAMLLAGVAMWGLAYGGAATLFQTASAKNAGKAADVAQSMIVTVWNLAIAGGGVVGGLALDALGAGAFPWMLPVLLLPTLAVAWRARCHGFPPAR